MKYGEFPKVREVYEHGVCGGMIFASGAYTVEFSMPRKEAEMIIRAQLR